MANKTKKSDNKSLETKNDQVFQPLAENINMSIQESVAASATEILPLNNNKTKKRKPKYTKVNGKKVRVFESELIRVEAAPNQGLTTAQITERVDRGLTNEQPNIITKSYLRIFTSNVFTLFNALNFFLATLILIYGSFKNMLFIWISIFNIVVGIVQEVRSKRTLEKMSLLSMPNITVIRDGKKQEINLSNVVIDDIVEVGQGAQIPADSVVVEGECEVNESLLTGEQDDVHKRKGDNLLSGSFVQAGSCRARVCAVGDECFAAQIMKEAKKYKKSKSELMRSINWIIRIVTVLIFPLGILMFFTNQAVSPDISSSVTSMVAAVIGMIPEGLVVLTSMALAVGVVRLAKKRTLVQELYCIETLARVDVLCLDKTGTITEGSMQVEQTHIYSTKFGLVDDIMANMVNALGSTGSTFEAFAEHFKTNEKMNVVKTIPFSSARKWSGVDFGKAGNFIVGAPEFVLKSKYNLVESDAIKFQSQGFRVLVLVRTTEKLTECMDENQMQPIALIVLSDKIRVNAKTTFDFFAKQGVELKVISGDNPLTVSKVAERAGLNGYDKFIDASADLDTEEKIYDACDKYTIFGRVNPTQKKLLVKALQSKGHTVGMTGDGVNDVMALKEADCSIAMASGSDATRNVAQLVLLDSDFSALPSVVAEGRRVINNIERATSLFLVKTTFSIVLTLIMIIFQMKYPFEPIQLSLVSSVLVGVPAFFLALESNDNRVTGNFLNKVFKKAVPAGLTIALLSFVCSFIYKDIGIDVSTQVSTMCFYIYSLVSLFVLIQVCMPFTKERLFLFVVCTLAYVICISATFLQELFSIAPLDSKMFVKLLIMLACTLPCMAVMYAEVDAIKILCGKTKVYVVKAYEYCKKPFVKFKQNRKIKVETKKALAESKRKAKQEKLNNDKMVQ